MSFKNEMSSASHILVDTDVTPLSYNILEICPTNGTFASHQYHEVNKDISADVLFYTVRSVFSMGIKQLDLFTTTPEFRLI